MSSAKRRRNGDRYDERARCYGLSDDRFSDSGKTQFLNFTLSQDYFQIDGKTLLILCEEGEEQYDPMEMLKYGVVIETVEDKEDLTEEWLEEMNKKHEPERVVIEYNGMWQVSEFEKMKLPAGWAIEQKITTVDASTFQMYLTNLKPLFVEMVKELNLCCLIVVKIRNRWQDTAEVLRL